MIITSVQKPPGPFEIAGSNAIFMMASLRGRRLMVLPEKVSKLGHTINTRCQFIRL